MQRGQTKADKERKLSMENQSVSHISATMDHESSESISESTKGQMLEKKDKVKKKRKKVKKVKKKRDRRNSDSTPYESEFGDDKRESMELDSEKKESFLVNVDGSIRVNMSGAKKIEETTAKLLESGSEGDFELESNTDCRYEDIENDMQMMHCRPQDAKPKTKKREKKPGKQNVISKKAGNVEKSVHLR